MTDNNPTDTARRLIEALYQSDAWLCSIPHGQYESYVPYSRERAIQILADELGDRS